jgi:hypothetical protein
MDRALPRFARIIAALLLALHTGVLMAQPCPIQSADDRLLARCLLRPVLPGGHVGPALAELPAVLDDLIGKPLDIDWFRLRQHLSEQGIPASALGGDARQDLEKTRFFVIHDTSWPEIRDTDFPAEINDTGWAGNSLATWLKHNAPTHVYVGRTGASATRNDFSLPVRATIYEYGLDIPQRDKRAQAGQTRNGLFVHVELVQPRRRSNPRTFFDLAPSPGFTLQQLERLALLYVVASYRSQKWLLPAYHAAVDTTLAGAHDDPQNFDAGAWLNSLRALLDKVAPTADAVTAQQDR